MNKRKILSAVLALAISASITPMAFAEEAPPEVKPEFAAEIIGGEQYESLADAVAAAENGATIRLLKDSSGSGIGTFMNTKGGTRTGVKDLTIDFDGHTYTCVGPAVGSMGTESQAFHLEKGAEVLMMNGEIETTSDSGVLMLVQNYCDLTLENMTLDGTNLNATSAYYTMSNNFGEVNIVGDTTIIAHEGGVAFDVCWAPRPSQGMYADGTQVYVDTTGRIEGKIEIGTWGNVEGTLDDIKSTLYIKNCNMIGEFSIDSALEPTIRDQVVIAGGNYTDNPSFALADGYRIFGNGPFAVSKANISAPTVSGGTTDDQPKNDETTTTPEQPADKTVVKAENSVVALNANTLSPKTLYQFEDVAGNIELQLDASTVEVLKKAMTSGASIDMKFADGSKVQKDAIETANGKNPLFIDINLLIDGNKTSKLGGKANITVPFKKSANATVKAAYLPDGDFSFPLNVPVHDNNDGTITLTASHFSTYVVYEVENCNGGDACASKNFTDVSSTDWFHADVDYAVSEGIMNGTSNMTFAPNAQMTRAMLVTTLWRMNESPVVEGECKFTDVSKDAYYYNAVLWANENGIVNGNTATTFAPNAPITREQFASILYRYVKSLNIDVLTDGYEDTNILSFDDFADIHSYAIPAIQWACGAGIFNTTASKLNPTGVATRAQTAAMLHRMQELVEQNADTIYADLIGDTSLEDVANQLANAFAQMTKDLAA